MRGLLGLRTPGNRLTGGAGLPGLKAALYAQMQNDLGSHTGPDLALPGCVAFGTSRLLTSPLVEDSELQQGLGAIS